MDRVAVVIRETNQVDFIQGRRWVDADGNFSGARVEIDAVLSGPPQAPTWSLSGLTLPQNGDYTITVMAVDGSGQYDIDQTGATAQWLIFPGDPDPYTWIQAPNEGDNPPAGPVIVNGRAFDDVDPLCTPGFECGVQRVDLQIVNSQGLYQDIFGTFTPIESWQEVFLTNPGGQFSNWSFTTLPLPDDDYTIRARAVDLSGQVDQTVNPFPADPGQEPDFINITVGTGPPVDIPGLTLAKSALQSQYTAEGDTIDYEYLLTNTGTAILDGPFTVTDDRTTVSCPADATLAVGASITCTAQYTITAADVTAGSVTNTATGHASFNAAPVDSNVDTATVTLFVPGPALTLAKTALQTQFTAEGDTIDYEYLLTNSGNVELDGPFTVTDDRTTVSCPADTTLAVGNSITCTSQYTITAADVTAGSVTNTATGHGVYAAAPVDSNVDTATVTLFVPNPQLTLAASVLPTTYDEAGDTLDFSYLLTNNGDVVLDGPFTVSSDLGAVSCPGDTSLGIGASLTCTASYTTDAGDVTAGSVTSNATAAASYDGSPVNSNADSATATYEEPPPPSPLAFRASASSSGNQPSHSVTVPGGVQDGDLLLMAISVNNATETISNPAGWTVLDTQADGSMQTRVWYKVAAGDAGTNVTITLGSRKKADLVVAAYSGADQATPILGYAVAGQAGSSTTHVTPNLVTPVDGSLIVSYWGEKNSSTTSMTTSEATVRHANSMTGGGAITALLADSNGGVPAGTQGGLTATADADSGRATMWTIALTPGGPPPPPAPALALAASVDPSTYGDAGVLLTFSYELTNTGNVALDGPFTASSDLGAVTCPGDTSLAVGNSITCTGTYTTDAGDVTAGSVTSNASAAGAYDGSPVNSNADSATATYEEPPPPSPLAFRASASSSGNLVSHSVTIPGAVQNGDVMIMAISVNNATQTITNPAGWTVLDSLADGSMQTRIWYRVASGDAGTTVTIDLGARQKADLVVAAYSGVDTASPILGYAVAGQAGSSTTHVTPNLATAETSLIVSYWGEKNSSTTSMTTSQAVTRHANSMTGGGAITALLADSDGGVAPGTQGGLTATADADSGRATMWTIALRSAP